MRLPKFLAHAGVASRRTAEKIIAAGRVSVDGNIILDPAFEVAENDKVEFDRLQICLTGEEDHAYLMLNKPVGIVSTMQVGREKGRSLSDLIQIDKRVYPVGRLDRETSGLILLTNDGNLTNRYTSPRYKIEKEYLVKLNKSVTPQHLQRLMAGVTVEGRKVEIDAVLSARGGRLSITIHEGRKRIVRRLFDTLGYKVIELKRIRIGSLRLGKLGCGRWRHLTEKEVYSLKNLIK